MKKGNFCPLIKKDCIETKCAWFQSVSGRNPQTGEFIDNWQCVINLLPLLLIENSQQQRQTGACIDAFRNETLEQNKTLNTIFCHSVNQTREILTGTVNPVSVTLLEGSDSV